MQSRTRLSPFQDPKAYADLLRVRAARLALRWEMGGRPPSLGRPPHAPKPAPLGPTPTVPNQDPDA